MGKVSMVLIPEDIGPFFMGPLLPCLDVQRQAPVTIRFVCSFRNLCTMILGITSGSTPTKYLGSYVLISTISVVTNYFPVIFHFFWISIYSVSMPWGELGTCTRASFTYSRVDIETRSGYKAELLVDKWDIDQVQICYKWTLIYKDIRPGQHKHKLLTAEMPRVPNWVAKDFPLLNFGKL